MHHGKLDLPTAQGLKVLRARIAAAQVPPAKLDETMLLATWNVREFGKKRRKPASLHFIAEILGQFDLIAMVEVRDDTSDLQTVLRYLGPYWSVVFSDYLVDAGGNRERIAFVFDTRNVQFTGLASHAHAERVKHDGEYLPEMNWWRPPYMASFRSGNFDFVLLAAHIRWGEKEADRTGEIRALAKWVSERMKEKFVDDHDVIVVGDFNIPSVKSPLYAAFTEFGLTMPKALLGTHGSNLEKDKRYDQIAILPAYTKAEMPRGGVLDFYGKDHAPLFPGVELSKEKFTYELSDHLPLWMEVDTDNDEERLDQALSRLSKSKN